MLAMVSYATVEQEGRTVYSSDAARDDTINARTDVGGTDGGFGVLRVATLNMAHGRKDSFNQLFLWTSTIEKNLDDVATVLQQQEPDIVALQEADDASYWSGSFNHVAYVESEAQYPWYTQVVNAESWLFSYGTALLSDVPINETVKHTFASSPPTLNKGFVLAQIDWPAADGGEPRKLDIISVHLDFSRRSVREAQIREMLELLSVRMNPSIIMGDFNSEWLASKSVINTLASKSRFVAYKPENPAYNTYKDDRLDWILITKDLEFVNYRVLSEVLSDHRMVIADIRFKEQASSPAEPRRCPARWQ